MPRKIRRDPKEWDGFFDVPEVMDLLHVSRLTIERLLRDGILRRLKVGRRTLVSKKNAFSLVKEA